VLAGGVETESRPKNRRAARRASRGRNGNHRGNLRSLDTDASRPSCCWRLNVRKYWRIISGMLIRSAAEKFWMAISIWRSGFSNRAIMVSARLFIFPASYSSIARPSSSASWRKSGISEATIGTP
jgi:hypothetical protein